MSLTLQPSDIYYCQNSINNVFQDYGPIGHTLDDIIDGNLSIDDLPPIRVCEIGDRWFALDNRRLWICKHLEEMDEISEIDVEEVDYIPQRKFTTENDGESIFVRGDPDSRYLNGDSDEEDDESDEEDSDEEDDESDEEDSDEEDSDKEDDSDDDSEDEYYY